LDKGIYLRARKNNKLISFALVLDNGALPPGLALRQSYESPPAAIAGTPTTAGTYTFKLRAKGEGCTMAGCPFGERDYTLVVAP
jgi:hypothetical protein